MEKYKEECKTRDDDEEDVRSYWMTLRKWEETGILKRKH
jgi:hypothetical protein